MISSISAINAFKKPPLTFISSFIPNIKKKKFSRSSRTLSNFKSLSVKFCNVILSCREVFSLFVFLKLLRDEKDFSLDLLYNLFITFH